MTVPGCANPLLMYGDAGVYQIERSLRFNSSDSGFLSRTPASAGNRKTWTWAGWVKRSSLTAVEEHLWLAGVGQTTDTTYQRIYFDSNNKLRVSAYNFHFRITTQAFRDFSAWFHLVVAVDTTQATASNRVRVYVNGTEVTAFDTINNPAQNDDTGTNSAALHYIGAEAGPIRLFNGYLADVHLIDGQQLDSSSFTSVSATTGQLIPKAYTGSFGTNGFWLKFSDNSAATATTIGKDYSGNSNNWTPNNLSVTAGAGNDSLVDTPTSYGTDTSAGGEVRGNYCTLYPLAGKLTASPTAATPFNGNLEMSYDRTSSGAPWVVGTIAIPASGKWYWEYTITAANNSTPATSFGVISTDSNAANNFDGGGQTFRAIYNFNGNDYKEGGTYTTYASAAAVNDVIGIAVDMDAGSIYFHRNGSWANGSGSYNQTFSGAAAAFTDLVSAGKTWVPLIGANGGNNGTTVANFGQRAFAYTAPSGFKALCDTNLPAPVVAKPNTVMDVKLYTGNGGTQAISGLGFSPDLVWVKGRSTSARNRLFNVLSGVQKELYSDLTNAEATDANGIQSFDSAGFTLGSNDANTNGTTYVGWCWDAGTSTVSNTQGSITSSVRANASAGFSIVTYTGTGAANSTFGHGLGVAPALIITKNRGAANDWYVYHSSLGVSSYLSLNTTGAVGTVSNYWSPVNSTVFGQAYALAGPNNGSQVAYCFAPVSGYSSGFSYTGNGSTDGVFVYLGLRAKLLLIKRTDTTGNWYLWDTVRNTYNVVGEELYPNLSNAAATATDLDILSNGFKMRSTAADFNASGGTYVGFAWAETPFVYSRAR